uniref:Uncharacterized protein n=1 Tax=Mycena chlorophos TaxID=658473 RepID=A0ABQ0L721_MYCCL|nr:predicted protein [Mycena chlorophos]
MVTIPNLLPTSIFSATQRSAIASSTIRNFPAPATDGLSCPPTSLQDEGQRIYPGLNRLIFFKRKTRHGDDEHQRGTQDHRRLACQAHPRGTREPSAAASLDGRILARIFSLVSHIPLVAPLPEPEPQPEGETDAEPPSPSTSSPVPSTHAPAASKPAQPHPNPKSKEKPAKPLSPKPHRLLPLLLVNQHWHATGTPLLYARISLTGQSGPWVAKTLRRSLEKSRERAGMVQSLVLDAELSTLDGTEDEIDEALQKETREHLRIVRAASAGLREVTVLSYASASEEATPAVSPYASALASAHALTTLNVSNGLGARGLFTFAGLLQAMSGWTGLERLVLRDVLLPASAAPSAADSTTTTNAALKMVKIIDTFAPAQDVSFVRLAEVAPNVEVLWVEQRRRAVLAESKSKDAKGEEPKEGFAGTRLFEALGLWKGTLVALAVISDADLHLESVLATLPSLRQLDVTAYVLAPSLAALKSATPVPPAPSTLAPAGSAKPSGIHTLSYHRLPGALVPSLAEALADAQGVFPGLRCVVLKSDAPVSVALQPSKEPKVKGKSKSVYGVPTRDLDEHEGEKTLQSIAQAKASATGRVRWDAQVANPPSVAGGEKGLKGGYAPNVVQVLKVVCRRRRVLVVV